MATLVKFRVNEANQDLFAYFPQLVSSEHFKTSYSHVGQHSSCAPEYAKESRPATPEEYAALKAELEQIGYELKICK